MVHEFGHVLGFSHEQNRSDSTCTGQDSGTDGDLGITIYDHNSVMNYCGPNNGNITTADHQGVRGIYGGADVPTSGSGQIAIRSGTSGYKFLSLFSTNIAPTAAATSIGTSEKYVITKHSGSSNSYLDNGDVVYLKNSSGRYLSTTSAGVVSGSTVKNADARWTVVRRTTAAQVEAGDEVHFKSNYNKYLTRNGTAVWASTTSRVSEGYWRILALPSGKKVN